MVAQEIWSSKNFGNEQDNQYIRCMSSSGNLQEWNQMLIIYSTEETLYFTSIKQSLGQGTKRLLLGQKSKWKIYLELNQKYTKVCFYLWQGNNEALSLGILT